MPLKAAEFHICLRLLKITVPAAGGKCYTSLKAPGAFPLYIIGKGGNYKAACFIFSPFCGHYQYVLD